MSTRIDPEKEQGGVFGLTGAILNTISSGLFTIGGIAIGGAFGYDLGIRAQAAPIPQWILTGVGAGIGLWAGQQLEKISRPVFYTGAVIVGTILGPNVAQLLGIGITRSEQSLSR